MEPERPGNIEHPIASQRTGSANVLHGNPQSAMTK
jgi:hypothetical protein